MVSEKVTRIDRAVLAAGSSSAAAVIFATGRQVRMADDRRHQNPAMSVHLTVQAATVAKYGQPLWLPGQTCSSHASICPMLASHVGTVHHMQA